MRRYALRDDQWDRIKDFLPGFATLRGSSNWTVKKEIWRADV